MENICGRRLVVIKSFYVFVIDVLCLHSSFDSGSANRVIFGAYELDIVIRDVWEACVFCHVRRGKFGKEGLT